MRRPEEDPRAGRVRQMGNRACSGREDREGGVGTGQPSFRCVTQVCITHTVGVFGSGGRRWEGSGGARNGGQLPFAGHVYQLSEGEQALSLKGRVPNDSVFKGEHSRIALSNMEVTSHMAAI